MNLRDEHKNIVIAVLIILNFASSLGNVLFLIESGSIGPTSFHNTLRVARTSNPVTMDPVDSWDSVSNDILDQVVETLITYDLTDPELPLVGRLAESWYWTDNRTITFQLRENVFFHDGSKFTADCVLHTFSRINYFGNWSGRLTAPNHMAFPHSLYKFVDGIPILNDTLSFKTNDYNVSLVLNRPFGPVEGLLTYTASSIVHPDSTPLYEMLDRSEDLVIGTGPFKLIRYIPNQEIYFERWERYWSTGAFWEEIVYIYYKDGASAENAILSGVIDYLYGGTNPPPLSFELGVDPNIMITGNGTSNYITGPIYWYICFKSEWVNLTWRKAICHAFNYSYLVNDIEEDTVVKANSLVPPGLPAHNSSVVGGVYNIPYARQLIQSMGYGHTGGIPWDVGSQIGETFIPGDDETLWLGASFIPDGSNFTNNLWYFRHRQGSHFMELLIQRFTEDMDLIGINVQYYTPYDPWWIDWDFIVPDRSAIYFGGWGPDYFETYTMINALVNPSSPSNFAHINNSEINGLLALTDVETNTLQRYEYYKKLQYLIHDKYYYHMPLFYDKLYYIHSKSLKGFPYNSMGSLYWYPTYRE